MDKQNYVFDFTIPQGPTGPTGPTGPSGIAGGLSAYGGRYSDTLSVVNLRVSSPSQVPLANFVVARNTDYDVLNSITVKEEGVYEISYTLNATVSTATSLTVAVREDNRMIGATKNTQVMPPNYSSTFYGTTIYTLAENSVIDLVLSSTTDTTVTLNNNASLVIRKIHS